MRIRGRRIGLLLASVLPLLADDEGTWIDSHDSGMSASSGQRFPPNGAYRPQHEDLKKNDLAPRLLRQGLMDDNPQGLTPSSSKGDQYKDAIDEDDDDHDQVRVTSSTSSLTATQSIHADNFRLPSLSKSHSTITIPSLMLPEDNKGTIGTSEKGNVDDHIRDEIESHEDVVGAGKINVEASPKTKGKNPLFERLEEAAHNVLSRTYDDRNKNNNNDDIPRKQGNDDTSKLKMKETTSPPMSTIVPNSARVVVPHIEKDSIVAVTTSENIRQSEQQKHKNQHYPIHTTEGDLLTTTRTDKDKVLLQHTRQQHSTDTSTHQQSDETFTYGIVDDTKGDVLLERTQEKSRNNVLSLNNDAKAKGENVSLSSEPQVDYNCINGSSTGKTKNGTCDDALLETKLSATNSGNVDKEPTIRGGETPTNNETVTDHELKEIHEAKGVDSGTAATEAMSLTLNDTLNIVNESLIEGSKESVLVDGMNELPEDEDYHLNARVSVDYASKAAGAQIIEKSSSFKGTSSLLNDDRDRYAIAPCQDKKFVVMSLSEDIRVEVIKLANYERFSSTVKDFQVMGSQTLGKWTDLGTYRAASGHGEQVFPLKNTTWARYLKFRFLTHHGAEYYCTVSQIKVHGSTVVEGFHEQWKNEDDIALADEKVVVVSPTVGTIPVKNQTSEPGTDVVQESASAIVKDDTRTAASEPKVDKAIQECVNKTNALDTSPHKLSSIDSLESHKELLDLLRGDCENEHLFEELYSLIPSVLSSLSPLSRKSVSATAEGKDERIIQRISQMAIQSFYSMGSTIVGSGDSSIGGTDVIATIAAPKMDDWTNEAMKSRFGSGLDSLLIPLSMSVGLPKVLETTGLSSARPENNPKRTGQSKAPVQVSDNSDAVIDASQNEDAAVPDMPEDSIGTESDSTIIEQTEKRDITVLNLLKGLPSAECLSTLDLATFKAKASASRKPSSSNGQSQGSSRILETPIYQTLMDQIVALQISLSAHDQYTKASVDCYQRVLLDLAMQMNIARSDQEERLKRLEEQMMQSAFRSFSNFVSDDLAPIGKKLVSNACDISYDVIRRWIIDMKETCVRLPSIMIPLIVQYWYRIRQVLHSMDSESLLNKTISPLLHKLDDLVDQMIVTPVGVSSLEEDSLYNWLPQSSQGIFAPLSSYCEDGLWTVSVLSVMFVLILCRLIMCFTGSTIASSSSSGRSVKELSKRKQKFKNSSVGGDSVTPSNGTNKNDLKLTPNDSKSTASGASSNSSKSRRRRRVARAKDKEISNTSEKTRNNSGSGDGDGDGDDNVPILQDEVGEIALK
jgi:hypothetical protein